jgi:levanase/fructan beta-fructosidase
MDGEKAGKLKYQSQAIAYSLDEGQTFTKYSGNPVIENPGIKDFRDPKMVWDSIHNKWLMVLAAGQKIMFYSSSNLKDWNLESDFGEGIGGHGGVWECPDFFPMIVQGTGEVKWVLLVSINPGGPNSGSATQYFVGDFDGNQFKIDASFEKDLNDSEYKSIWIDYGKDNYAGVTWANIPDTDGRKLFVGWMSNWQYAQKVPSEGWRSSMTTARELTLIKNDNNQFKLKSYPVKELNDYVAKIIEKDDFNITEEVLIARDPLVDFTSAEVEFTIENLQDDVYTFKLHNDKGEAVLLGLNNSKKFFFIDRSESGNTIFQEDFGSKPSKAPAKNVTNNLEVKLVIDKSSIEVFYNRGEIVMTELFFSTAPMTKYSIKSNKNKIDIKN